MYYNHSILGSIQADKDFLLKYPNCLLWDTDEEISLVLLTNKNTVKNREIINKYFAKFLKAYPQEIDKLQYQVECEKLN